MRLKNGKLFWCLSRLYILYIYKKVLYKLKYNFVDLNEKFINWYKIGFWC